MIEKSTGVSSWFDVTSRHLDEEMLSLLRALGQSADLIGFIERDRCHEIVQSERGELRTSQSFPWRMLGPFVGHHLLIRVKEGNLVAGYFFTTEGRRLAGLPDIKLNDPRFQAAYVTHLLRYWAEFDELGLYISSLFEVVGMPVELRKEFFEVWGRIRRWFSDQTKPIEVDE